MCFTLLKKVLKQFKQKRHINKLVSFLLILSKFRNLVDLQAALPVPCIDKCFIEKMR